MSLAIDGEVAKRFRGLYVGLATIKGVSVARSGPDFDEVEGEVLAEVRRRYRLERLKDEPLIWAYRDLLWRLDLDPTKLRPSAESMLRRVLRGEGIPRINNVVDAGNLTAVKTLVPIGVYDLDLISGPLVLRFARKGEDFVALDEIRMRLTGKELVIADEEKIVHLYPCRDSEYTRITVPTRNVLGIACGAPGVDYTVVRSAVEELAESIKRFAGGKSRIELVGT